MFLSTRSYGVFSHSGWFVSIHKNRVAN